VSPSVLRLRGYTPEEVMGEPVSSSLTHESLALLQNLMAERLLGLPKDSFLDAQFTDIVDQPMKNGHVVTTEVTSRYLQDESTGRTMVVGVSRDITERVKAEEKARASAEAQRVLLMEVNHRVKNNLAAIMGIIHLEERRAGAEGSEVLRKALSEIESRVYTLAVVHSMLSGGQWRPLPLDGLIRQVIEGSFGVEGENKPLLRVAGASVLIDSSRAHNLALVVNELATNTLKHCKDRDPCEVAVNIGVEGGEVLLTYRDNGPGFPEAMLEAEKTGWGAGLQLIRGIVTRSLGGSLTLDNDQGAKVVIRFKDLEGESNQNGS